MVNASETRLKLIKELNEEFSNISNELTPPDEPVTNFPSPRFDKPKMFMPQTSGRLEVVNEKPVTTIRGMGFRNVKETRSDNYYVEGQEIYSMKDLINANPENMQTFSYDEKVVEAQLALVKKKEWQDVLFGDVDWFMKIDLTSGIKKIIW